MISSSFSVGDQLALALDDVRLQLPWSGRSPRDLTRVASLAIFKPGRQKSVSDFVDPDQIDLFEARQKKEELRYVGAPLLIPLGGK